MKPAAASISKTLHEALSIRGQALLVALAVTLALSPAAFGQCSLTGTVSTWNDGNSNWNNGANWNNGVPNSASTSACITDGSSTVSLDIAANVNDLQLGSGNVLNFDPGTSLTINGTQIINAGAINVNGGGGTNTYLYLPTGVTLSGGGTLTLSTTAAGGGNAYLYLENGVTLDNVNNTIQGEGLIYNNGTTIANEAGGTINANSGGSPLINGLLLEYGAVTNAGLMEATNNGSLVLYSNTINNAGGNITGTGSGASVVLESTYVAGGTFNSTGGAFVGTPGGYASTLDGSTGSGSVTINGTYTTAQSASTSIYGAIVNNGNLQVNGGAGTNSYLYVPGNVTLTGAGTVNLSTNALNGGNAYLYLENGATLDNVNNVILGEGLIYNNGTVINNHVGGTINANSSGSPLIGSLTLEYGVVNNAGLLEATNNGSLVLYSTTINNAGANITASGSGASVVLEGVTVNGGTLNNNGGAFFGTPTGYADTLNGPVTINGTYTTDYSASTYLSGSIVNNNNLQVNGGNGTNSYLYIGSPVTLTGGGTVNLSTIAASGGNANLYLYNGIAFDNVNNTIQGEGLIYNNGTVINNHVAGIINANSTGSPLNTVLELEYGTVNNLGLIEANNSGNLELYSNVINNTGGGVITANGAGASVEFYGTTIQGGTLDNNGAAFFGTPTGYASYLDGSTTAGAITLNGTYTTDFSADTYLYGSIVNNTNLQVNGGNGTNSYLYIGVPVTLTGGGTVSLNTLTGSGNANLYLYNGITFDNVDNTIQGEGLIYNNGTVFNNHAAGIINANSTGGSLATVLSLEYGTFNNQGLIEATNNGDLQLYSTTVNNAGGGVISINGAGTSLELYGTTIQGGTLNNNGGAFMGTPSGYAAYLDGSTAAGPVTINGTYTTDFGADTYLYGTINNQGNLLVNGGNGSNAYLWVTTGTVTLTGGGTVSLVTTAASGGDANIYLSGGATLDNISNTIQGEGVIYNNGATLINEAGGTIAANSTGSPLTTELEIQYGTVTNNGTFQVNSGDSLVLYQGAFTNYASNTLTGGTYNIYGATTAPGTLEIDALGSGGGEIINNAATILLNGPNSNFVDSTGNDALSNFSNNTSAGSFTIQSGRNFTSPSSFANAGVVNVGTGSTFATGGTGNYNQSGGATKVDGALVAGGGHVNINGGTLLGNGGTITGNVTNGGTVSPGDFAGAAGALGIVGNYIQTASGIFQLDLGGLTAGTQFDLLNVSGTTSLTGTLDISLINAFFPAVGNTFTFLTSGGAVSGIFSTVNGLNIGNGEMLQVVYQPNDVEISTIATSPVNDYWNGGTGVWSNGSQWSLGTSPGINNNAFIYSGGNDLVTLNIGSGSVNQLNLGGALNGFTSELTDGGTAQNLTITNGLSIGANGFLDLTGASTITAATMANSGYINLGTAATLTLTSQPSGITDAVAGSRFDLYGTFTAGAANGFAQLNSIEGTVNLFGQTFTDTPGSGTLTISNTGSLTSNAASALTIRGNVNNSGYIDMENASTIKVNGNVTNSGTIYTSFNGTGGNTFNVTGTLNNTNFIGLESTDTATIGGAVTNSGSFQLTGGAIGTFTSSLTNSGTLDLENASTLNINSTVNNSGTFSTSANGGTGSNNVTVAGLFTNQAGGQLALNGPSDTLRASGGLANSGTVTVKNGSTIDPPFVNNLGTINIDGTSTFVVGTGSTSGTGFIQLANGTYGEMINSATAFGQVNVADSASLNGTLDILLMSGYNPAIGTSFTYLDANPGQLSGTYSTILNDIFNGGTEKWVVNYNDAGGYVQLTAATNTSPVPEPGSFLLLGSGLIGLAYSARRRWTK